MRRPDVALYLLHIADSCEKIQSYLNTISQEEFLRNKLIQDAVIRNFEIIGEAAKHIPEGIRWKYSNVNWRGMTCFRNLLIHEYFGVDLIGVWNVAHAFLPAILSTVRRIPEYVAAKASLANSKKS